jgi:hypothetical protein
MVVQDKVGHRSPVITTMLVLSLPVIFIYAGLGASAALHIAVMILLGVTISGPYNLIVGNAMTISFGNFHLTSPLSGTIAVDLGSQPALAGNTEVAVKRNFTHTYKTLI